MNKPIKIVLISLGGLIVFGLIGSIIISNVMKESVICESETDLKSAEFFHCGSKTIDRIKADIARKEAEDEEDEREWQEYLQEVEECEAKGNVWYGNDCKTKEEAERLETEYQQRKAEEEKKKIEEQKLVEEPKQEETKQPESIVETKDDNNGLPDGIELNEVISLCNRTLKSIGYGKIKFTNSYPMGYPNEIYVIVGTVNGKITQCQANWLKWEVKSITISGGKVYGE